MRVLIILVLDEGKIIRGDPIDIYKSFYPSPGKGDHGEIRMRNTHPHFCWAVYDRHSRNRYRGCVIYGIRGVLSRLSAAHRLRHRLTGSVAVTIQNFTFSPASITVPKGTTVTWMNQDSAPHQILNDAGGSLTEGGLFFDHTLAKGATYSFKFDTPWHIPVSLQHSPVDEGDGHRNLIF